MRAILFDIGGTLLLEQAYDLSAGIQAILDAPGVYDCALRPHAWHGELVHWIQWVHREERAERSIADWLRARLDPRVIDRLSLEDLERRFWCAGVRMAPVDGAAKVLSRLSADGIVTGVVSNTIFTGATMRAALHDAGLHADFSFVLSSSEERCAKPDRRIFQLALLKLGGAAHEIWFVGDSWLNDIVGASRAGLFPVWFRGASYGLESPEGVPDADVDHLLIQSLSDLLLHLPVALEGSAES